MVVVWFCFKVLVYWTPKTRSYSSQKKKKNETYEI